MIKLAREDVHRETAPDSRVQRRNSWHLFVALKPSREDVRDFACPCACLMRKLTLSTIETANRHLTWQVTNP